MLFWSFAEYLEINRILKYIFICVPSAELLDIFIIIWEDPLYM